MPNALQPFGGTSDPHGSAQTCLFQRTADFELVVTLSFCKVASSGVRVPASDFQGEHSSPSAGDEEDGQES